MTNDIFILVAIISAWLLVVFSISEFLERFDKKSRNNFQTINYGLKGILYLFAVFVWTYSIWIRKKIEMVDIILIFMFFLESISYFKLKKKIIFKNKFKWILTCFMGAIIIGSPFIVKHFTEKDCWIDFWGGYLGAIIGGIITLFVMKYTLNTEKKAREREEAILFFNEIINTWATLSSRIGDLELYISKFSKTGEQEDYMEILLKTQRAAEVSQKIVLLLNTRKEQYRLDELIRKNSELSFLVNDLTEKAQNRELGDNPRKYVLESINKIEKCLVKTQQCVAIAIRENLYNL